MRASVFFASVITVAALTGCSVDGSPVAKDDAQSPTTNETSPTGVIPSQIISSQSSYEGSVTEVMFGEVYFDKCTDSNTAIVVVTYTTAGEGEIGVLVGDFADIGKPASNRQDPGHEASLFYMKDTVTGEQDAGQVAVPIPLNGKDISIKISLIGAKTTQLVTQVVDIPSTQCAGQAWQN
ncbi:hypothetical protein A2707_01800 [Candidatus Saccharibacteria bacterium RIFCSPHIGHO2_01_FULL_45_15]|nr:MAG: hypothetical protein A2707_01800 [Candidatus Saccharibacteria bacterium RIFCSPHIGHO2_01_FULL_45_15]OGL27793.1 MAG: hypothetical protein A3C39_04390 [Candidatus Saccharibacteria bacterium RIFCSPHIGHO2_02_FULL_46_12]OGL31682.1 MAG: hypothetical protein A3E76_01040 [Candidatus Saccharibacteria bacterium RIFCSPHIGHO2_12_FULL_44_22]